MLAEELLPRLSRVRRAGSGWVAICPGHEDRSPSLSVCDKNGRLLLHCFAGCTRNQILAGLGLRREDLWPQRKLTTAERESFAREKKDAERRAKTLRRQEFFAYLVLLERSWQVLAISIRGSKLWDGASECFPDEWRLWWGLYGQALRQQDQASAAWEAAAGALGSIQPFRLRCDRRTKVGDGEIIGVSDGQAKEFLSLLDRARVSIAGGENHAAQK